MLQHEAYLDVRPRWADDPDYRAGEPAFLLSPYQTKRLDLGHLTLLDKTTGGTLGGATYTGTDGNEHYNSKGSAHGELYDDFAFTAGLRRYYWDVYVDEAQTENPLMAHNYFTADATRIFSQSAGAALVAVNQNLNATLGAFDKVEMFGPVDQVHVGAYVGGGTVRAKTGSHVDVDSVSAALTVSKKTGHDLGETTLGLFGEFGHGNYDTFASIARYGDVMGDGNVNTYGGGFFFRTLFSQNTFIEASVRGGGIHNDYSLTRDPWIQNPGVHSYETNNSYYGAHLGLGQKFDLGDLTSLEGYGRYFWTRTHKDEFTTGFGDKVELDAVDSSRARLGARLNRSIAGGTVQFYVGAAAEHEFDGKITGRYAGDPISDPPKIRGTSGFGEIGLNIMPTGSRNFSINTEVFGLTGRQEGVGGSAAFSLNF